MPVVLIGALGGMAAEGLIGLFVGAVMLSVGYKLLMSWVEHSVAEHQALGHPMADRAFERPRSRQCGLWSAPCSTSYFLIISYWFYE